MSERKIDDRELGKVAGGGSALRAMKDVQGGISPYPSRLSSSGDNPGGGVGNTGIDNDNSGSSGNSTMGPG